ncbi:hypothetical protein, partial [Falsiroseomonas sp. CW058]|uniref:hypothetical protein n=1 Tax=Falsiroseomonas sp. CW058 TaxID=3388664 RepID=UPI003D31F409
PPAAAGRPRQPPSEEQIRFAVELLLDRAPTPREFRLFGRLPDLPALRQAILAGAAPGSAPGSAPATAPPRDAAARGPDAADLAAIEALGAGAAGEPGFIVDWFGLRTPLGIAPDLAAGAGKVLPAPVAGDSRARAAEWAGLARSVAAAAGTWHALSIGAGRGDLLLAGAVAARRRGLTPVLQASEADPRRFAALLEHAAANGIDPAAHRFQQAEIGPAPAARPARGASVQDILAEAPSWDWVQVAPAGTLVPLLQGAMPLLTERVRILSLATHGRLDEMTAIRLLSAAGWTLLAEQPAVLDLRRPKFATRSGAQVWRAPQAPRAAGA